MAVFMINICKFDQCGIIFKNLADLIQHIEENHIDNESSTFQYNSNKEIENATTCLPLSYVLRFYTNKVKVEDDQDDIHPSISIPNSHLYINNKSTVPSPPHQLSTPTNVPIVPVSRHISPHGSELGEDMEEPMLEDSNDSWTLAEEYSSEYILKHGSKMTTPVDGNVEKPFACPVPGCKKRYKNVNGIKYHSKNGHKTDGRIYKNFKCHCGKSYKTSQGLKNHNLIQHDSTSSSNINNNVLVGNVNNSGVVNNDKNTTMTRIEECDDLQTDVLQVPSSRIRALTLKHIEALGVPVKSFLLSNRTPPTSCQTSPNSQTKINVHTTSSSSSTPSNQINGQTNRNNTTSSQNNNQQSITINNITTNVNNLINKTSSPPLNMNNLVPNNNTSSILNNLVTTNQTSSSNNLPSINSIITTNHNNNNACLNMTTTGINNNSNLNNNSSSFITTSSNISLPGLLTPATSPSSSPVSSLSSHQSV